MNNLKIIGNYNLSYLQPKMNSRQEKALSTKEDKILSSGNPFPLSLIALKNYNLSALAFGNQKFINQSILNPRIAFQGKGLDVLKRMSLNDIGIESIHEIDTLCEKDKTEFVKEFCNFTGFPNLAEVTAKMISHAGDKIINASDKTGIPVLWSGYHKHCSASKGLAFPGSDLDALAIIVDGGHDQNQINRFKGEIWDNFNPLLVSIRKDCEFPDIYSIDQLHQWTKLIDEIAIKNELHKKAGQYAGNLKEKDDYNKALAFNIDLTTCLDKENIEELKQKAPLLAELLDQGEKPKWITHSMSSLLESLRSGKIIIPEKLNVEQQRKIEEIKNSYLCKYGNICIQDADYSIKPKLLARKEINDTNFNKLPLDAQISLIKRMIYESYSSREKSKLTNTPGEDFNNMFSNGEGVNASRDKAFQKCV